MRGLVGPEAYLIAAAVIVGLNLLPAFAPPTVVVVVWFTLVWDLRPLYLVPVAAAAAGLGRYGLARGTRLLRRRMSPDRVASLGAAADYLAAGRRRVAAAVTLFVVSPLPSNQLFEGAGLLAVPLAPLVAGFVAGRLVTYSMYSGAASLAGESLQGALVQAALSPWGIAVQVVMLVALVLLARVDWRRVLARAGRSPSDSPAAPPS